MYKVDPSKGDVAAAFRAVVRDQLDEALAGVAGEQPRSAVHEARRRCKKLRAVLRLVRPGFSDYGRENAAIRDAAALLSHLRDAEVLAQTVAGLDRERPSVALGRIVARLGAEPASPEASQRLAQFVAKLEAVRERAAGWQLSRQGLAAVLPGFVATYRQARRRLRKADATQHAADFHDWRKANKYHGFHLDLLKRLAPDVLAAEAGPVDRLSDLLGRHHDLAVLVSAAAADPVRFGSADDVGVLRGLAEARMAELGSEALALGRQVYAERPRAVRARLARYWKDRA